MPQQTLAENYEVGMSQKERSENSLNDNALEL
jgi:hypothetical protein